MALNYVNLTGDERDKSVSEIGDFLVENFEDAEEISRPEGSLVINYRGNRAVIQADPIYYEHPKEPKSPQMERTEAWRVFTLYPQEIHDEDSYRTFLDEVEEEFEREMVPGILDIDREPLTDPRNINQEYIPQGVQKEDLQALYLRVQKMRDTGMF